MGKSSGMCGNRSRNADGRLRRVPSDKHLQMIRQQYNIPVVPGRGDTHLGTIRKQTGKSETKLIKG